MATANDSEDGKSILLERPLNEKTEEVIFLAIESVSRRKLSDKFMERAQVVGMVLLLALMAFAIGNDVWKHILN